MDQSGDPVEGLAQFLESEEMRDLGERMRASGRWAESETHGVGLLLAAARIGVHCLDHLHRKAP